MEEKYVEKDCQICLEERIRFITCPKCHFSSCSSCVKRYLLESPSLDPICMNADCKAQWTYEFVADNTDDRFHNNEYRQKRAKILLERERSLLPATQPAVAFERKREKIRQQIGEIDREIETYMTLVDMAKKKRRQLTAILRQPFGAGEPAAVEEKNPFRFVGFCPQPNCRGFLNTEYICGICEEKACRICRQIRHKGDCDPEIVETVRLLAKDTKPCPNCSIPITKISGCDQMFCTKCGSAFSWKTGKIEHGQIHNPHYYEMKRQGCDIARDPGDVRCGGQIDYELFRRRIRDLRMNSIDGENMSKIYALSGHIRQVVLPLYTNRVDQNTHQDLRVKFLLDKIDERGWLRELQRREKRREKSRAVQLVLLTLVDSIDAIHDNFVTGPKEKAYECLQQLEPLRKYIQTALDRLFRRFKNKMPLLTDRWDYYEVGVHARGGYNFIRQ